MGSGVTSAWGESWGDAWGGAWSSEVVPEQPVPVSSGSGYTVSLQELRQRLNFVAEAEAGQGSQTVAAVGVVASGGKQLGGSASAICDVIVPSEVVSGGSQSSKGYGRAALLGKGMCGQAGQSAGAPHFGMMIKMKAASSVVPIDVPRYDGDDLYVDGYDGNQRRAA